MNHSQLNLIYHLLNQSEGYAIYDKTKGEKQEKKLGAIHSVLFVFYVFKSMIPNIYAMK